MRKVVVLEITALFTSPASIRPSESTSGYMSSDGPATDPAGEKSAAAGGGAMLSPKTHTRGARKVATSNPPAVARESP